MNGQRRFPAGVVAASLALLGVASRETASAPNQLPANPPATHNMLVVGEQAVFLSHLPMFQVKGEDPMPHRYQVILEAKLARQEDYAKDRREHPGTTIYTLNPEDFILPELVSRPLSSFKAKTLFRGHLERDGSVPVLENADVSVQRVIHFRELDAKAKRPRQLEYLLFGKGDELFLAHLIVAPPDFDQILSVKIAGHPFTDAELAQGVSIVFPKTRNTAATRLKAQRVAGEATAGSSRKKVQVDVSRELYFEEGELRVPATFDPTAEEVRAGFP
jgi:hypothetical protein